ncbi:MAG: hypothetical protein JW932_20165 [Deltaproteobacteria bacterium]|nr:hypothetical protein [Deltaproteobacteria bacterium]
MLRYQSRLLLTLFLSIPVILSGCGYSFQDQGESGEITSIAIPLMTSTSTGKGFEADFTSIIRNEFISHARIPILSREEAQAVLIGHIHEIQRESVSFSREPFGVGDHLSYYETTNAALLRIKLDVHLKDRITGKTIWREKTMEERTRYDIGADPITDRFNQQQAILKVARALAKRLYLKTMERF